MPKIISFNATAKKLVRYGGLRQFLPLVFPIKSGRTTHFTHNFLTAISIWP
ncbi:MAG: hypothetical protein H6614_05255 [Ignavibacteriales bacterium]|nr:hypothetical protein [Ignavibacteriales bacterium]